MFFSIYSTWFFSHKIKEKKDMEVHIFHPKESFKDETFRNFIQDHYKIPVVVHDYNEQNSFLIFDFLQDKKDEVLVSSLIYSEDVSMPSISDSDISYEFNKTILKKRKEYLGGLVILQSDSSHVVSPTAIMNLYQGMLILPISHKN